MGSILNRSTMCRHRQVRRVKSYTTPLYDSPYEGKHMGKYSENGHHHEPQPNTLDIIWSDTWVWRTILTININQLNQIQSFCLIFSTDHTLTAKVWTSHLLLCAYTKQINKNNTTSHSRYWGLVRDEFSKMSVDRKELFEFRVLLHLLLPTINVSPV